ncbi:spore gernimation protein KA [Sporosarcina globispora]|uniref:Spore gernimation protein KA n=1 Tax=Sporosarcina globispora TaxID=1459 RepID=A0A0M0GDW6_SPOGL|nr:spore germination protein [Sporosarcina globispora]KON88044.1 spore gernimation protein KA [Sporosarcina globispora]
MRFHHKKLFSRKTNAKQQADDPIQSEKNPLHTNVKENIRVIKETLGNSDDIITREIRFGKEKRIKAGLIYMDGLTDSASIQNFIMESLMVDWDGDAEKIGFGDLLLYLKETVITAGGISNVSDYDSLYDCLLTGYVIVLLEGYPKGIAVCMKGGQERSVTEPSSEISIRGPKDAFTENIRTNTALIRRKINNPNLWMETKRIGKETKTHVTVMYIKGIANDKVVEEVRQRLDRISIDSILDSSYIEELIQDETYSPFPTLRHSERPDVVSASLLEGRVAILVDGTPYVLMVPALFVQFLQSPDDYYNRADISTLIRFLRYIGFFIALLGPSVYIAITTFHQEMLPTPLLISLAGQREGVPFPAFIEALMMEVTFEILREAGIRLPKAIGQAVSIVGTLVIGTAAVDAGIVSAAMVIVVSITAISSFIVSSYNLSISIRMLRFPFMVLAASFGLFGMIVGLIALTLHLCSLRSFGVPYMSPFGPFIEEDQKDAIFRLPRWAMSSRPRLISQKNINRENTPAPKPGQKK